MAALPCRRVTTSYTAHLFAVPLIVFLAREELDALHVRIEKDEYGTGAQYLIDGDNPVSSAMISALRCGSPACLLDLAQAVDSMTRDCWRFGAYASIYSIEHGQNNLQSTLR